MAISLFMFSLPPSFFINSMSIINLLALMTSGFMEIKGKNKKYAKFFKGDGSNKPKNVDDSIKLPSRIGMLVFYTPSFIVGLFCFAIFRLEDLRFAMVMDVLTIHFFKRILEVLFVHKFSGSMMLEVAITIGLSYSVSFATMIYAQYLSQECREPSIDLKYIGLALFSIGISGNFYHHYILSNLRKKGDKEYKIPTQGLFGLVICPHYLFEIVEFLGVACISQTAYAFCFTIGTIFLLIGRSHATRKWYVLKFGAKFRSDIKAIIPFLL